MDMSEIEVHQAKEDREEGSFSADDFPRPTSFIFKNPDDLDLFYDKVRVEQDLRIDCEMQLWVC